NPHLVPIQHVPLPVKAREWKELREFPFPAVSLPFLLGARVTTPAGVEEGRAASGMTLKAGLRVECAVTRHRQKRPITAAGSDDEAVLLDSQGQRAGGPGFAALRTGEPKVVNSPAEIRWSAFGNELADSSFGSVLAVPLDLGPSAAATMNLFSVQPGAFTQETTRDARQCADMAARALRMGLRIAEAELKASDLSAAMTHRTVINMWPRESSGRKTGAVTSSLSLFCRKPPVPGTKSFMK
ncbi:MAG: GAF domain-containing protein, partial [Actinomycetes bacterium]